MEELRVMFVLQKKYSNENEVCTLMRDAYETCRQNTNVNVSWIKEDELKFLTLNKTDFLVFEDFSGSSFEEFKATKCARIVGPWVISVCLMECKAIPNFTWPIMNVAMYDCNVTCTHLPKEMKRDIQKKVELMGGCYVNNLITKSTHLVTNTVKTEKYLKAAEAGVKIMTPIWIEEVWKTSHTINIHADDEQFNKFRCPPLSGLVICSTGLNHREKKVVEKLTADNGGTFTGKLTVQDTDVLICDGELSSSEKYKAARQKSIKCVTLNWLYDSIKKGYALSHIDYQVQKITSTPTKPDEPVNPEFSMISAIGVPNTSQRAYVEDTITSSFSSSSGGNRTTAKRKVDFNDCGDLVDRIDMKKAKKAGQFLDGCSVYIIGFGLEHTEKLNKIINLSGATRYDTFSERVTHVIVGNPTVHEVKLIKNKGYSSFIVTLKWLIDSIEQEHILTEENYLMSISDLENNQPGSPLSKKGLNLLRTDLTITEEEMESLASDPRDQNPHQEIVQQYLKPECSANEEDTLAKLLDNADFSKKIPNLPRSTSPPSRVSHESSVSITQDGTESTQIFEHLKFLIVGFDDNDSTVLTQKIKSFSGEVVSKTYKGIPDFAVIPIFNPNELHYTAAEVVNDLYIFDCEEKQELIQEILYYHRPLQLSTTKPLQNCVITLTSYFGFERAFLRSLIEELGAVAQDQFARVTTVEKGVVASTHLVSPEASGKKYEAALKWKLPVVRKDWLLECARTGQYEEEGKYLVGKAKLSKTRSQDITSMTESNRTSSISKSPIPTPTHSPGSSLIKKHPLTPFNQKNNGNGAEKPFSQVTPISKIMQNFRENNLDLNNSTPKEYTTLQPWMNLKTPDTPLGAFLTPNPSPNHRKQWEYWLDQFPSKSSPKSNQSTPLSAIKQQLWNKAFRKGAYECDNSVTENEDLENKNDTQECPQTPEHQQLADRLDELQHMLTSSEGVKRQSRNLHSTIPAHAADLEYKDSQPCTVGWDYQPVESPKVKMKIFSLSGVSEEIRNKMISQIESLGGSVSDLTNYDPSCTHLLSSKPARNEKTLSCMAAGKWILHISYLEKSVEAGHFIEEEEYEFGNPKSLGNIPVTYDSDTAKRMHMMFWWRKEISKRGYGAFNDMRAVVVAQKKEPIERVIEAGGGTVVDARPPFKDMLHLTHCLLEPKSVQDITAYTPLVKKGVYVVNTIFISDYLDDPNKDIRDCIYPYFTKYYKDNSHS